MLVHKGVELFLKNYGMTAQLSTNLHYTNMELRTWDDL